MINEKYGMKYGNDSSSAYLSTRVEGILKDKHGSKKKVGTIYNNSNLSKN
jgi:hypothetical protein